jgi:hypothetical protein
MDDDTAQKALLDRRHSFLDSTLTVSMQDRQTKRAASCSHRFTYCLKLQQDAPGDRRGRNSELRMHHPNQRRRTGDVRRVEDARTQDGLATPFVTRIANSGHAYAGTARERVGCHVLWHKPDIEFNEKEFESFRSDVTVVTSVVATTITTLICVVATTTLYSFAALPPSKSASPPLPPKSAPLPPPSKTALSPPKKATSHPEKTTSQKKTTSS